MWTINDWEPKFEKQQEDFGGIFAAHNGPDIFVGFMYSEAVQTFTANYSTRENDLAEGSSVSQARENEKEKTPPTNSGAKSGSSGSFFTNAWFAASVVLFFIITGILFVFRRTAKEKR